MSQQSGYDGEIWSMPKWARQQVAPWYIRFLVNQFTLYFAVLVGIGINTNVQHWSHWLCLPSYILLVELCGTSYRQMWMQKCLEMLARMNKTPETQKPPTEPILSPFVKIF